MKIKNIFKTGTNNVIENNVEKLSKTQLATVIGGTGETSADTNPTDRIKNSDAELTEHTVVIKR